MPSTTEKAFWQLYGNPTLEIVVLTLQYCTVFSGERRGTCSFCCAATYVSFTIVDFITCDVDDRRGLNLESEYVS
jgi:hypothetical protein